MLVSWWMIVPFWSLVSWSVFGLVPKAANCVTFLLVLLLLLGFCLSFSFYHIYYDKCIFPFTVSLKCQRRKLRFFLGQRQEAWCNLIWFDDWGWWILQAKITSLLSDSQTCKYVFSFFLQTQLDIFVYCLSEETRRIWKKKKSKRKCQRERRTHW